MLTRNQLLLAKTEVTEGTDAAPVNTDAINCSNVDFTFDPQQIQRPEINRSLAAQKKELGRKMVRFSFTCSLKGSGTAGAAPQIGKLLTASAFKETVSAGVSVTYKPSSAAADHKTLTMWFYQDGKVYKAIGCRGTWTMDLQAGQIPVIKFEFTGKFTAQLDATMLALPTFEATNAVVMGTGQISFGTFNTAVVRSMQIMAGNQITERADMNSVDGFKGLAITQRDPTWNAMIEGELEATKTFWANMLARTEELIDVNLTGSAGNITIVSMAKAVADNIPISDESGIVMFQLTGQARDSVSGDDSISIAFT